MLSDEEFAAVTAQLAKHEAHHDDNVNLQLLRDQPELFAFLAERERLLGGNEADVAEIVARSVPLDRGDVRKIVAALRPLGYSLICDRLISILPKLAPGRRKMTAASWRKSINRKLMRHLAERNGKSPRSTMRKGGK